MSKKHKHNKNKNLIETNIGWNDREETEILNERFTFQGINVLLSHGLDGEPGAVMVAVPSKVYEDLCVYVTHGDEKLVFCHQRGEFTATAKEIENALLLMQATLRIGRVLRS